MGYVSPRCSQSEQSGTVPRKPAITLYSQASTIKKINMKQNVATPDSTSQTFLTGAILFANLDYSGLGGYAIKAAIGGAIWMVFKLAGDYISEKILNRKKTKQDDENEIDKLEE
jgi:hypothetical protein